MSIAILGGGISGLSAAYYLKDVADVTVYEKARPGGIIDTRTDGRFFFEKGPRTFSTTRCKELLELIDAMGLSDDLIFAEPQKRYIYHKGQLQTVQAMALKGLLRGGYKDFYAHSGNLSFRKRGRDSRPGCKADDDPDSMHESGEEDNAAGGDESRVKDFSKSNCRSVKPEKIEKSVHAFAEERFGKWVADHIMDAVTLGIHAAPSKELSLDACFPSLANCEGSLIKRALKGTKGGLFTLRGGMCQLIDALASHCTIKNEEADADVIYSTLPAYEMAKLTGDERFNEVHYSGITCVHLGYERPVLKKQGFGYLVPSCYGLDVMGVVFDSCVFPQQNRQEGETRLTVMLKAMDEKQALECALDAVRKHLGIKEWPHEVSTTIYEKAIPKMRVGHQALIDRLKADHPNIILAGSYVKGPAVNTCIKQARELASQLAGASSQRVCASHSS